MKRCSILKKLSPISRLRGNRETRFSLFPLGCYFHPIRRISVVRASPSPTIRGNALEMASSPGLVATCAREKMPEAKLKPGGGVSSWNGGNGFSVGRCFVRLWSLDTVVSVTDASNCVASLFLEPRTDIPRRKRDQRFVDERTGLTSASRDNPSWGVKRQ